MGRRIGVGSAINGTEIGITWFRQRHRDGYPIDYLETVEAVQAQTLTALKGLHRHNYIGESDMTVWPDAFDAHWQLTEWERT